MFEAPRKHLIAVPVLFLLYFYGLNEVGVLGPDEPRYASIGRSMAESGDWITPRLWNNPWFEKPALLYWMVGLGYKAGLGDDLAPRLPVAILCVGFLFFYFHQLRREFGETTALYSAMMLATSAGWLAYGQIAVTDMPLAATFASSMLCCLPWIRSGGRRGLLIGGVLLGLAVLAKGLVPLVLAAPLCWVGRRRWRDLLILGAAALVVALPWYVLCWYQNGSAFVDEFIWKHHLERFASSSLQHVQPWWYFVPVFAGLLFPWLPALLLLFRRPEAVDARRTLLIGWLVFGFVFFSVSKNKLPGYVLPLLPAACALMGLQLSQVNRHKWVLPVTACLVAVVPVAARVLPEAIVSGLGDATFGAAPYAAIVLALCLGAVCFLAEKRNLRTAAMLLVLGGMTTGVLLTKLLTYGRLDAIASARPIWIALEARKEDACTENIRRAWRYGLNFYSRVPLPDCGAVPLRNIRVMQGPDGQLRIDGK